MVHLTWMRNKSKDKKNGGQLLGLSDSELIDNVFFHENERLRIKFGNLDLDEQVGHDPAKPEALGRDVGVLVAHCIPGCRLLQALLPLVLGEVARRDVPGTIVLAKVFLHFAA